MARVAARVTVAATVVLLAAIGLALATRYAPVTRALRGLLPGWPWW